LDYIFGHALLPDIYSELDQLLRVRGAPHSVLAMLTVGSAWRISCGTAGRRKGPPGPLCRFPRKDDLKPRGAILYSLRLHNRQCFRNGLSPIIQPGKIKRSMALNVCLLGECRLSMFNP